MVRNGIAHVHRTALVTLVAMDLESWNRIPDGYGADFDLQGAPWWLRVWFHTPFVDRFAYPIAVRRGYGWLSQHPGLTTGRLASVPRGWRIRPDNYQPPGASAPLWS